MNPSRGRPVDRRMSRGRCVRSRGGTHRDGGVCGHRAKDVVWKIVVVYDPARLQRKISNVGAVALPRWVFGLEWARLAAPAYDVRRGPGDSRVPAGGRCMPVLRGQGRERVADLEGKCWSHGATTEAQGHDRATAAGLRLHKNRSGERGPDEPERGRAHRRVSRAADSEAELTVALDGART